MSENYEGPERREFVRIPYSSPLSYKVCKPETLLKLFQGYTVDVSNKGLRCTIKQPVNINDIVWLSFDRSVLTFCAEIERYSLIYQHGIIAKVVRIQQISDTSFDIGVKFLTIREKDSQEITEKTRLLGPDA
ncbi:MAG: PilZ domain-containing protein [Candidatus Omnitrophica bacterium]|nr:PilZ domain-containing protein [Candidatus Omnitrophota bacterium]